MTKGNYIFQKPVSVIGTERLSAGLYRIWYKGADVGIMSWVPGETHSRRWVCDAGVYLTQREALAAMEKLLLKQIGHYIWVYGNPVPKQSTRFDGHGHAHTDPRVKSWQDTIRVIVRSEYQDAPIIGDVSVTLTFALQDRKRRDLDNLSKAVLDALNGLAWVDDTQVVKLSLAKSINKSNPGVGIMFVPVEIVL